MSSYECLYSKLKHALSAESKIIMCDIADIANVLEELKFLRTSKETMYREIYNKGRADKQNEIIKALAEYNTRNLGNAEMWGYDIARGIVEQIK